MTTDTNEYLILPASNVSSVDLHAEHSLARGDNTDEHLILPASTASSTHAAPTEVSLGRVANDGVGALDDTQIQLSTPPPIKRGTKIGRYEIIEPIGKGGMGEVWRAHDPKFTRSVAIKFIRGDENDRLRGRMRSEAQVLHHLRHPNIPRVHDVDEDEYGRQYIVMDYIGGTKNRKGEPRKAEPLPIWLHRRQDELELGDILRVFLDIGDALQAVHERRLIHRDIKPANILIDHEQKPWLVDFGLIGQIRRDDAHSMDTTMPPLARGLTQAGARVGTLSYIAPEVLGNTEANERSDQYAFCVSLYEALFNRQPYPVTSIDKAFRAIMDHELVRPHDGAFAAELPDRLWKLLQRGLAKDPDQRFASMAKLNAELADIMRPRRRRALVLAGIATLVFVTLGAMTVTAMLVRQTYRSSCLSPADHAFLQGDPQGARRLLEAPLCSKGAARYGPAEGVRLARMTGTLFDLPDGDARHGDELTAPSNDVSIRVLAQLLWIGEEFPTIEARLAALEVVRPDLVAQLSGEIVKSRKFQLAPYMPLTISALLREGVHDPDFDQQLAVEIDDRVGPSGEPALFLVFARQHLQPDPDVAAQQLHRYADDASAVPELRESLWALRAFRLAIAALEQPDDRGRLDAAREALRLPESGRMPDPRFASAQLELAQTIVDQLDGRPPTPMQLALLEQRADAWWWDHHYRSAFARLQAPTQVASSH